eukprot:8005700-Ditylum_brightwellii.AAC.1
MDDIASSVTLLIAGKARFFFLPAVGGPELGGGAVNSEKEPSGSRAKTTSKRWGFLSMKQCIYKTHLFVDQKSPKLP